MSSLLRGERTSMNKDLSPKKERNKYQIAIDQEKLFLYWNNIARKNRKELESPSTREMINQFDAWCEEHNIDCDNPPVDPKTLGLHLDND